MTQEQTAAVNAVAAAYCWDRMPTDDLGLLLWALFRYYAARMQPGRA